MSYEIEIWCTQTVPLPADLLSSEQWLRQKGIWVRRGRGWHIVIDDAISVDPEDVPEQIGALLPGIAHLIRISVEPSHAPKTAHQLLMRSARSLAKAGHGAIYDPQDDSLALGAGVKKFAPTRKAELDQTLMLSWWFGPDALATKAGFEELVQLLRRHLPDALPRRYGTFEPPEHRLSETGEAHLVKFLATEGKAFMPVLFPHRPVTDFSIHLPDQYGQSIKWGGFRANTISIQILAAALRQPGWERQIRHFWQQMCEFLQPFYGDVRHMAGVQPHPVRAWFWRGFPRTCGVAAVVGHPYLNLWPQGEDIRKAGGSLAYLSSQSWSEGADVFAAMGGIPADLVNPNDNYWGTELYPSAWPFDLPE